MYVEIPSLSKEKNESLSLLFFAVNNFVYKKYNSKDDVYEMLKKQRETIEINKDILSLLFYDIFPSSDTAYINRKNYWLWLSVFCWIFPLLSFMDEDCTEVYESYKSFLDLYDENVSNEVLRSNFLWDLLLHIYPNHIESFFEKYKLLELYWESYFESEK